MNKTLSPTLIIAGLAVGGILILAALWLAMPTTHARSDTAAAAPTTSENASVATFAGGCFWCMEPPFDKTDGVISTTSGYMGGSLDDPGYKAVSAGGTGHAEVVQVAYDPSVVSYESLLDIYWRNVDPLTAGAQFCDQGSQYRSAIFTHDEDQRALAESSKQQLVESQRFDQPIVTEINDATSFWPAEDYHQDYYQKNPIRYKLYRTACGRDARLAEVWGDA